MAQTAPPAASDPSSIGPVVVTSPNRKPVKRAGAETAANAGACPHPGPHPRHDNDGGRGRASPTRPKPPRTPLNSNVVATSASRLGLTAFEMPASVEIVDQRTMQEQGYRTTTETAQGAVGVLAGDSGGASGSFSMRGFTTSAINILYNGIWIGPSDITSRMMDTSNLDRVEFLKGPSSHHVGAGRDRRRGQLRHAAADHRARSRTKSMRRSIHLGTYRTHFGSGGSTTIHGLDYRVDIGQSKLNSFIDGDYINLTDFSAQFNYRVTDYFKVFAAIEYKQDHGHAYWGTPLVPITFCRPVRHKRRGFGHGGQHLRRLASSAR